MPTEPTRFPYNPDRSQQEGSLPFLPIQLQFDTMWVQTTGLVDSGASINVIPYAVGLQLGRIKDKKSHLAATWPPPLPKGFCSMLLLAHLLQYGSSLHGQDSTIFPPF